MTAVTINGNEVSFPVLAGSAFPVVPKFLDKNGDEYQPTSVHVKVTLKSDGSVIQAETLESGWTIGTEIVVTRTHTTLQVASALREDHVVQFIGDTSSNTARNPLRLIVGCVNPDR